MARTPLLRGLRSLVSDLRIARAHRLPFDALPEVRAARGEPIVQQGVSRREFLAAAGAAAASSLMPRSAHAAGAPTIVIAGGGIAGMACALELADAGIRSTVYEASGRIGGRMFSNTGYWRANQVTEW